MDTPMDSATVRAKALWTDLNVWHKVLLASILLYLVCDIGDDAVSQVLNLFLDTNDDCYP